MGPKQETLPEAQISTYIRNRWDLPLGVEKYPSDLPMSCVLHFPKIGTGIGVWLMVEKGPDSAEEDYWQGHEWGIIL